MWCSSSRTLFFRMSVHAAPQTQLRDSGRSSHAAAQSTVEFIFLNSVSKRLSVVCENLGLL